MASGTEQLTYLAGAIETTRGTAITTMTRKLYPSACGMTQDVNTIIPKEMWGNFTPGRRHYAGLERVGFQMQGDVTYTDWPYLCNTGVSNLLAGVLSDTTAYTWAQTPQATNDQLKSLTLEYGTSDLVSVVGWRIPGLIMNEYSATWRKTSIGGDETGLTYNAAFMTASGATQITAFTGSLSDRTPLSAIGTSTLSYVNATGSAFGTTADAKVREATLTVNNGFVYRDTFDGTNHAASIQKVKPLSATLTLQRHFDDKTELDAYIAKTTRRVQLITTGALAGAATAVNTIKLRFNGVPTGHDVVYSDGFLLANITLTGEYESAVLTAPFDWTTVNSDSTTLS